MLETFTTNVQTGTQEKEIKKFKVGSKTRVHSLAGFVLFRLQQEGKVELIAMGPHAVNNAMKAIAIARKHGDEYGFGINTKPDFVKIQADSSKTESDSFTESVGSNGKKQMEGFSELDSSSTIYTEDDGSEFEDPNKRTAMRLLLEATSEEK